MFRYGERIIWLGIKEEQENEWTSAVDGQLITFNRFQSNRSAIDSTLCGAMDLDQGRWLIKDCDLEMNFVCRKKKGIPFLYKDQITSGITGLKMSHFGFI